jgi:DNA polymerase III delta prime subunit
MRGRSTEKEARRQSQSWVERHRPVTWSQFEGNNEAVKRCKEWIRAFQSGEPGAEKVLHICGPEGCGKSTAASILLKRAGFDVIILAANELKNHKGDKHRLDNFCGLYTTKTTALRANNRPHALLIVNYGALLKTDKTFDGTLQRLVERVPNPTVPLVVTSLPSKKRKAGLIGAKTARCVEFNTLTIDALCRIARRILSSEGIPTALNSSDIEMFSRYSFGDARQLVMSLEMFLTGIHKRSFMKGNVQNWLEQNAVDDEKQLRAIEYHRLSDGAQQTEEERIIGIAVGDKGGKRRRSERRAALRTIEGTSVHFMPLIFACYPRCIPAASNKCQPPVISLENDGLKGDPTMDLTGRIAENISFSEVYHESTWGEGMMSLDLYGSLAGGMLNELNAARYPDDLRKFAVSTEGYKAYYGIDNTITNQQKVLKAIHIASPAFFRKSRQELVHIKSHLAELLAAKRDDEVVQLLWDYKAHPDVLETFARLKGEVLGAPTFTVTRKRRRTMAEKFEALEEANRPTVKRIEKSSPPREKKEVDRDNPFILSW